MDQWDARDFKVIDMNRVDNYAKFWNRAELKEMTSGTDILACNDGVVVWTTDNTIRDVKGFKKDVMAYLSPYGNHIVIMHGPMEYSLYCHLLPNSILVKKGDIVKQGQKIAKLGDTGNSSEPHLHFQLGYSAPIADNSIYGRRLSNFKFKQREFKFVGNKGDIEFVDSKFVQKNNANIPDMCLVK